MIFLNTETPKFYLMTGQYEHAKELVSRIYITKGEALKIENVLRFYQVTNDQENTKVGMGAALFTDDRYTRSSWVCIIAMCFQCLTGYYAIIAYSTHLLEDMEGGALTPRGGAILILACNLMGNIASIWFVTVVGRRTIFITGQALISLSLAGIATMALIKIDVALLICICLVSFLFQLTLGPIVPLYTAEVCTDVALGAVMVAEDVVVLLQDFLVPMLLESPLGSAGVFYIFAGFSVCGLVYVYFSIAEIWKLTDGEKKEVYMPGATWGRPLKEGEECMAGEEHRSNKTMSQIGMT
jgi:hypothetical protein